MGSQQESNLLGGAFVYRGLFVCYRGRYLSRKRARGAQWLVFDIDHVSDYKCSAIYVPGRGLKRRLHGTYQFDTLYAVLGSKELFDCLLCLSSKTGLRAHGTVAVQATWSLLSNSNLRHFPFCTFSNHLPQRFKTRTFVPPCISQVYFQV